MPNWCDNRLTVTGPPEEIKRFRQEVRGEVDFDFETILPTPPEMASSSSGTGSALTGRGMPDWWDWRTSPAGWSTKWGVDIDGEDQIENGFVWHFESAWSPPESIVAQLGLMYPSLRFVLEYAEGGNFFAGSLIMEDGELVEDLDYGSQDGDQVYQFVKERFGWDWRAEWEEEDE